MEPVRATAASSERRRLGLALASALALHALVLTLLPPPSAEPPPRETTQALLVELRETAPPLPAEPVVKAVPRPTPAPARPSGKASAPKAVSKRADETSPLQAPSLGSGKESAPDPSIDLFSADALGRGLALPGGTAGQQDGGALDGNTPAQERARVSARVEADIGDTQAQARVRNGMIDPWFRRMAGLFTEAWQPTAGQVDGHGDGIGGHLKSFVGQWQETGEQYAATGSPFPTGAAVSGPNVRPPDLRPGNGLSGFDPEDFRIRWNDGQFATTGAVVLVRLEQSGTGLPLRVELLQSSGSASLDGSALDAIRARAGTLPAPERGLGLGLGEDVIRTVWRFHARVISNTCTPILDQTGQGVGTLAGVLGLGCGGTFDLATGEADAQLPLERRIIATVELVALYGGALMPFDASAESGKR